VRGAKHNSYEHLWIWHVVPSAAPPQELPHVNALPFHSAQRFENEPIEPGEKRSFGTTGVFAFAAICTPTVNKMVNA
jgi:hypothetical protein